MYNILTYTNYQSDLINNYVWSPLPDLYKTFSTQFLVDKYKKEKEVSENDKEIIKEVFLSIFMWNIQYTY